MCDFDFGIEYCQANLQMLKLSTNLDMSVDSTADIGSSYKLATHKTVTTVLLFTLSISNLVACGGQ